MERGRRLPVRFTNLSGDFDVQVRVASLTEADPWSKAGLMARAGTDWDAIFFDVITTPATGENLCDCQCRAGVESNAVSFGNSSSYGSPFAGTSFPNMWLRLQRTGNMFQGYRSSDGANWTSIASTNIGMPASLCVGLATTAHDSYGTGLVTTVQYRDITITGASPDTTPPTIAIISPTSNSTYSTTLGSINLGGTASDNVGLTQVTWSNNRGGSGTARDDQLGGQRNRPAERPKCPHSHRA